VIAPWGSLLFGLAGTRSAPIILDALILGPDSSPGEPGSRMCLGRCEACWPQSFKKSCISTGRHIQASSRRYIIGHSDRERHQQ